MRARLHRRLQKQIRRFHHKSHDFTRTLRRQQRSTPQLPTALLELTKDTTGLRIEAAQILATVDERAAANTLLEQFFAAAEKADIWQTALAIEQFNRLATVGSLIRALRADPNPHRRQAAARALGWMSPQPPRATTTLIRTLTNRAEDVSVRGEAAESLAYCHRRRAIAPLISALSDRDAGLRFWAVFALGGQDREHPDPRIVPALETLRSDGATPPGSWWPINLESRAILANFDLDHRHHLHAEIHRVLTNPNARPDERRWAEFYDESTRT